MNSLAGKFAAGLARILPSGKDADPLSSLRAATRWLDGLPVGDAFHCQQAITVQLKRFNDDLAKCSRDRLAVFMLLDEKSRDLQDTLVKQYLRNPRMSRQMESQLWHAVYALYWEAARGYHRVVRRLVQDGEHGERNAMVTLRAIRTFGQLLKWRAIRYLPASEKLWLRLHQLYLDAERAGFHRMPMRAYADDGADCSCETAYLHILMRELASSGRLYPRQIDLLDRWLCNWHASLALESHLDPEAHAFAVDLAADHGPRRVRKPDPEAPVRYWSAAQVLGELDRIKTRLEAGRPPAELGLTESARTSESLELIDYLQHQWAPLEVREQRRSPREESKRLMDVVHGLSAIAHQVTHVEAHAGVTPYSVGISYDEADDVHIYGFVTERTRERHSLLNQNAFGATDQERWVMHDESESGYGAIVESTGRDWLRVGALLAMKPHDTADWTIGIVRRLARIQSETCSVGIEILSRKPLRTMLYEAAASGGYTVNDVDTAPSAPPYPGVWLDDTPSGIRLVIDPVRYMPGKVLKVHGTAKPATITLGPAIESSEGWILVSAAASNG